MEQEYLLLKWGTLKGIHVNSEKGQELLRKYNELGSSMSCALQKDTPEQKQIICDIIDAIDGDIRNDWTGKMLSKEEAKQYVINYGKEQ